MSKRNKTLYFDIETNALDDFTTLDGLEVVHCLSIYDPVLEKMVTFSGDGIEAGLNELDQAVTIVGHNVFGFDLPALERLYKWTPKARVLDTMVTSRCVHSDLFALDMSRDNFPKELWGSHSLKAWGHRIGSVFKDAYGEQDGAFDAYNEDMMYSLPMQSVRTCEIKSQPQRCLTSNTCLHGSYASRRWQGFALTRRKRTLLNRR